MTISIGDTLAELRRAKKYLQKDISARLSGYGINVSPKTIYNWEKGKAQPNASQFVALCDILDVDDILWRFAGIRKGPYVGLNQEGRDKAREFVDLLLYVDMYRAGIDGADGAYGPAAVAVAVAGAAEGTVASAVAGVSGVVSSSEAVTPADSSAGILTMTGAAAGTRTGTAAGTRTGAAAGIGAGDPPRVYRLYDIPVSAGAGNFLDDSGHEMIKAPGYVSNAVDFALRVTGDSMEPLIKDGQVIWIRKQEALSSGDIGIFIYDGDVYCKELVVTDDKVYLRSLNPKYEDIEIEDEFWLKTIGKVIS